MSHEENQRLVKIEQAVGRIETALVGDSEMGNPGLVKRVGTVEGKVKTLQTERVKFLGAVAGASFVLSLLATYIFGR
jgi:hypothetical protein